MSALHELIRRRETHLVAGVFDAMSAVAAAAAGFAAVEIGVSTFAAHRLGFADDHPTGPVALAGHVRRVAGVVELPIIVDGRDGYGDERATAELVRRLEHSGASAVHIEDSCAGSTIGKIKAAAGARRDGIDVIAGTSEPTISGVPAIVRFAAAAADAGADGVLLAGRHGPVPADAVAEIAEQIDLPLYVAGVQEVPLRHGRGALFVHCRTEAHTAMYDTFRVAMDALHRDGDFGAVADRFVDWTVLDALSEKRGPRQADKRSRRG